MKSTTYFRVIFGMFMAISSISWAADDWTQFTMGKADADGTYHWNDAANWNRGVPTKTQSVEVGDDNSGTALHGVIPKGYDAICKEFELAEHARTEGTTLRIQAGASLTVLGNMGVGKDREGWRYVDGKLTVNANKHHGIRIGGPWGHPKKGKPANGHLVIGPGGEVDARYVSINADTRSYAPAYNPTFRGWSTDSEVVVDGGKLNAKDGLRVTTSDTTRPGALRLKGAATFTSLRDAKFGIDINCGIWEIDGGEVTIQVGDVEFHGSKYKDSVHDKAGTAIGPGLSILRLTGTGVSTIHARGLDFIADAQVEVSGLELKPGTYTVFDGESITGKALVLAPDTDAAKWTLTLDAATGNVTLTRHP